MGVYVDDMFWPKPGKFKGWCHLVADTEEELDAFAVKIGLKREWHQKRGHAYSHYDVSPAKRIEAIKAGAVRVTTRELGYWWEFKLKGKPTKGITPPEAVMKIQAERLRKREASDERKEA